MFRMSKIIIGAAALTALAGCMELTGGATQLPSGPPMINTFDPAVSNVAVETCRRALDRETDGGVSVVGTEYSEANVAVYMRVGAQGAPWRCLVSNSGGATELMYMGSEGAA